MERNAWRTRAGVARAVAVALAVVTGLWTAMAQERTPQEELKAEPRIIERGAHHRVVETVARRVTPFGREYFVTNAYTELRNGMHRLDNGEWKESKTTIEVFQDGAIARQGAHQAIWSPNLNVQGAVDLLTPDGKRFRSHILGLVYTDAVSGKSVLIAEPKDTIGEVVGNQVIYRDAFTGPFRADVRYTYTESGISQDILIREVLPSPGEYDLSEERSRIEVWTEFIEAGEPLKGRSVIKAEADPNVRQAMVDPDMTDETLDFGAMRIGSGSAFPLDAPAEDEFNSESAPVGKNWIQLEGRTFLIEKTDLRDIREKINQLPKSASVNGTTGQRQAAVRKGSSRERLLASLPVPERREAKAGSGTMRTALVLPPEKGFVLDYSMVSAATNFTFKSDTTYFISGNVTLSGTTVVESAVIKYTNGNSTARLIVQGPVICRTDSHRPVIFTSKDDDTVGEIIAGSTGNPSSTNGYYFDIAGNTNVIDLHNVRMRRGYYGVNMDGSSKLILRHAQLSSNHTAIVISGGEARLRNVLVHDGKFAYGGASTNNHAEHVTFHRVEYLRSSVSVASYNTFLTNSMVIAVGNYMIYTGANNASNSSDAGIFQTVGQGQRYLAGGSTNRNVGTTNINPDLLAALKTRTTYPPTVLANLNASTNLSPVVERDVSQPDRGYHYDVLDFLVGGVAMTNVTLTVTNGATIGLDASQTNYGIRLGSGATVISEGSPTNFNRFVRSLLVQEVPAGNSGVQTPLFADTVPIPASATTFKARFTDFPASPNSYLFNQEYGNGKLTTVSLRDSQLLGGHLVFYPSASNIVMGFTNVLFDRVNLKVHEYVQGKLNSYGSLFRGGSNYLQETTGSSWEWRNNLFDQAMLAQYTYGTFTHSHNGFVNGHSRLTPTNASDRVLTASPVYETNSYALYYLPSGSALINTGSTNAAALGLYHYTTTTNQMKETNSTVDIGLHFIALNSSGSPVDSDADGMPDYVEDPNGNGQADGSENSFANPVLTLSSTMTYIKGGPAKRFDTNAIAHDLDAVNFNGGQFTVRITSGGEVNDKLGIRHEGTGAGQLGATTNTISYGGTNIATYTGGSGTNALVISFNTNAVNTSVQALTRNLTFQSLSNAPASSNRNVSFTLTDGKGGTNAPTTQTINFVCPDSMDVMVLFDVSKSMTGVYTNGVLASNDVARYWTAKAAASNFVSLLNFGTDRVGLITFAETATLLAPLTTNVALVQSNIYAQVTNSGTILSPPLLMGRTNFTGSGSNTLKLMVILSDGEEFPYSNRSNTVAAANAAKDDGVRIISIGFYSGENIYKDPNDGSTNLLKEIASSTNDFYFAPSFGEMQSNFLAVAQSLCRGHSLVEITSPVTGTAYTNPPSINLQATASDSEGVTRVEFYQFGTNQLGEDTSSPYALTWSNPTPGTNSLTAVLIDGLGNATTSAPISVVVRSLPSITLLSPTNATHFAAVMNLLVRAAATDADGTVTNVVFFTNGVKAVTVTNPPFRFPWTNLNSSTNYRIHAVAWDNHGLTNTSATNTFVVEACSQVGVSSLTLSAYTVAGGSNVTATVTLVTNAPGGGQMVDLAANGPSVSIPASVFVAAGSSQAVFVVNTFVSTDSASPKIWAGTPVSSKTNTLTIQASSILTTRSLGQCGPMDVVFVIDRSRRSWTGLGMEEDPVWNGGDTNLPPEIIMAFTNMVKGIEFAAGGDYQLGLISFASNSVYSHVQLTLTNANSVLDSIDRLFILEESPAGSHGTNLWANEPSLNALDTAIHLLSAAQQPNQVGNFTNAFRAEARKLIVLMTEQGPAEFGFYTNQNPAGVCDTNGAHRRAVEAALKNIQICPVVLPANTSTCDPEYYLEPILAAQDYAFTTGGRYFVSKISQDIWSCFAEQYPPTPIPVDTFDFGVCLEKIGEVCGAELGEVIVTRDDLQPGEHPAITLNNSTPAAATLNTATFDLGGVEGRLAGAHLQRAGSLRVNHGSRFDLNLGAGSVLDANLAYFAAPTRSAETNGIEEPYLTAWELPFAFLTDVQAYLGHRYPVELLDRVSSICGNNFEVVDMPQRGWPATRNTLTLKTLAAFEIPQGRCRDFVLTDINTPCMTNGSVFCGGLSGIQWEIRLYGEVIATPCAPHGWSVESDHGVYGGVNLCAPADALTLRNYEVRFLEVTEGVTNARSGYFAVIDAGSSPSAPVLKPLEISHPHCSSNTAVTVTVSLDAPAREQEAIVSISVSGITNSGIPAFVRIQMGETTTSFTFRPALVTEDVPFALTAGYNGVRKVAGTVIEEPATLDAPIITAQSDSRRIVVTWEQVPGALYYNVSRQVFPLDEEPVVVAQGVTTLCFVDEAPDPDWMNCYEVTAANSFDTTIPEQICPDFLAEPVLRPRITPHGGRFNDFVTVTIQCETAGAVIRYTTNGVAPTSSTDGFAYIMPTNLQHSAQIIARAFVSGNGSLDDRADFHVAAPTPVECGVSFNGTLAVTNQFSAFLDTYAYGARYSFPGRRGTVVAITATSSNMEPILSLNDPSGALVSRNGVPLSSYDSFKPATITHTMRSNGLYFFEVAGSPGNFNVELECYPGPELDVFHDGSELANGSTIDFGISLKTNNVTRTITITNSGSATLNFSSVSITPPQLFSISPANITALATNSATNLVITFNGASNGPWSGVLTLVNNDDFDDTTGDFEFDDPFVVYLEAFANPPGVPPTASITSPTANAVVTMPPAVNLSITSWATNGSSVTGVVLYANGPAGKTLIGSASSNSLNSWSIGWSNAPFGTHLLTALAKDSVGRAAFSPAITVTNNLRPVAVNDRFTVFRDEGTVTLNPLANDYDADGDALVVTNILTAATNGTVWVNQGVVSYTPPTTGSHKHDYFLYSVADRHGIRATGSVQVAVMQSRYFIEAFATTADITAPLTSPEINEPQAITGTATSEYLYYWELAYRKRGANTGRWVTLASAETNVTSGTLGTFDPTALPNGLYEVRLRVVDITATMAEDTIQLRVSQPTAKIGHFTLAFTDLQIPVSGLPIALTRSYDSRNTDSGDFGAGWNLDVSSVRLEKSGVMGAGWQGASGGGLGAGFAGLQETEDHLISIVFPDDKVFRFKASVTLNGTDKNLTGANGLDQAWANISYQPQPGTLGTLRELNATPYLDIQFDGFGEAVTLHDAKGTPTEAAEDDDDGPVYDPSGFEFTTLDGRKFRFNALGKVTNMVDRAGNSLTFRDDGVIHSSGKSVKFVRDAAGRITEIYDPNGLDTNGQPSGPAALSYKYDSAGNLVHVHRLTTRSASEPKYVTTQFGYEHAKYPHYITKIIDPRGVTGIRNEYGDDGKLKSMTDASGKTIQYIHSLSNKTEIIVDRLGRTNSFVYDVKGNVTASTNALSHVNTYLFDANNNKTREVIAGLLTNTFAFDANNLLTESVVGGLITNKFTYNAFGQVLAALDGLGRGTTNFYDTLGNLLATTNALGFTNGFTYDAAGNLLTLKDALGVLTSHLYDQYGNLTNAVTGSAAPSAFTYDGNGNRLTEVQLKPGTLTPLTTNTFLYDAQNRVIARVDALGNTNRTEYNELGRHEEVIDALGRTNRYEYDLRGNLNLVTYADGTTEQYAYDAEGRRTNSVDRAGRSTSFVFDALGRLTQTVYPDNTSTRTIYDDAGRVQFTVDARNVTNAFGYDAAGRRIATTNAWATAVAQWSTNAFDAGGNLIASGDALGRVTRFTYDALNQRTQTLLPDNTTLTALYNGAGQRVGEVDQASVTNRFAYHPDLGTLQAVTNAWATPSATWATYAFDPLGRQTNQVDALGRKTAYEFDADGRRQRRLLPGGQWEGATFDAAGNVLRQTNLTGQIITNLYDAQSRLLSRWHGNTQLVAFTYNLVGQRASMSNEAGVTTFAYDKRDRLITNAAPVGTLIYAYDENGNLTNMVSSTSGGVSIGYQYDALNRLTNVVDNRLGLAAKNTRYQFDDIGNLSAITYPNGATNLWQYDSLNRLTNEVWKTGASALANFAYQLDAAGQRTNLSETVNGASRNYAWRYDPAQRLTNETITGTAPTGTVGYRMDIVGNRTNRTSTLSGITNQVFSYNTNDGLTIDAYDASGNTRTNSGNVFLYDWANRLTNAVLGTTNVSIVYNGDGLRVKKTVVVGTTTNVTLYLVDDHNPTGYAQVVEEKSVIGTTTNLVKAFVFGLDLISQRQPNVTTNFYGADGIGSTRFLLNLAGSVSDMYAYDAFGTILARTGTTTNENLFHGELRDSHLGLDTRPARYYAANFGRWWTMDSWEGRPSDPQSLHKYLAFADAPINYIDPSGRESIGSVLVGISIQVQLRTVQFVAAHPVYTALGGIAVSVAIPQLEGIPPGHPSPLDEMGQVGRIIRQGIAKGLAKVIMNNHHPLPKFLGGDKVQNYIRIPTHVHNAYHKILHERLQAKGFLLGGLGGPGNSTEDWLQHFQGNPGSQQEAFEAVLEAARAIDVSFGDEIAKTGTTMTQAVWKMIIEGKFTQYP